MVVVFVQGLQLASLICPLSLSRLSYPAMQERGEKAGGREGRNGGETEREGGRRGRRLEGRRKEGWQER